jgi:7-carboxy-7-deazaguanine synthase
MLILEEDKKLIVNEIFFSIQGEGPYTGIQMAFIRLTGCNLRCEWCDTKYAFTEGKAVSIGQIVKRVEEYNTKWICITGGEPLLQADTYILTSILVKKGFKVLLETNGSLDVSKYTQLNNVYIDMDYKLPSSGEYGSFFKDNIYLLRKGDYLKFTIADENDFKIAIKTIEEFKKKNNNIIFILQPVYNTTYLRDHFLDYRFDDDVRLMIQTHKYLWGDKRGV